tara:strand:- start:643 stop:798 length:156 start_codon:yes stop_codon:yes gene_type:complete
MDCFPNVEVPLATIFNGFFRFHFRSSFFIFIDANPDLFPVETEGSTNGIVK